MSGDKPRTEGLNEVSRHVLMKQTVAKEDALFRGYRGNIAPFRLEAKSLPLKLIPSKPSSHLPASVASIQKSLDNAKATNTHEVFKLTASSLVWV